MRGRTVACRHEFVGLATVDGIGRHARRCHLLVAAQVRKPAEPGKRITLIVTQGFLQVIKQVTNIRGRDIISPQGIQAQVIEPRLEIHGICSSHPRT
jgi:hypothetical protein